MPDDHSESVPPLPIPNRTVKRLHADDSADSRVKVGNRQAPQHVQKPRPQRRGFCVYGARNGCKKRAQNEASPPAAPSRHVMACSRRDFSSGRLSVTTTGSGNIAGHCPIRSNSSGVTPSRSGSRSRNPSAPDKPVRRPRRHGSPARHLPSTLRRSIGGNRQRGFPRHPMSSDSAKPVSASASDSVCLR